MSVQSQSPFELEIIMTKIVLKTLHNDIVTANPKSTLNNPNGTKMMRVWLRTNMRDAMGHDKNASWAFTQSQYDKVRAHFDPTYTPAKPAARKSKTKTPASADA